MSDTASPAPAPAPPATPLVAAADPRAAATVFFDGACPLCRREIAFYRARPGADALAWVDLAAVPDDVLTEGRDRDALLARFTVRRADGTLADGAAGFVAMWRAIPATRRLGRALDRWPLVPVAEIGYRLFLRLRPLWRKPSAAVCPPTDTGGTACARR
ncbi:MAG: DUF393 domain-containing protein [Pseudomonadota bacterium]